MFKTIRSHIGSARRFIKASVVLMAATVVVATFPVQFVKAVSIYDGDQHLEVYTFTSDTESILSSSNINVSDKDSVEVVNNSGASSKDITITIDRAFPINVTIGGTTTSYEVAGGTVADVLKEANFTLDRYDEVNVALEAEVYENMHIVVKDVDYTVITEEKTLKFDTERVIDAALKPGETRVDREGKNGSSTVTTFTKIVNGEVAETSVTEATVKPVAKKISYGVEQRKAKSKNWMSDLKPKKSIMLDKNGIPVKYSKKLTGVASAYCTGTTCSTGVKVKQGYIAVDPNIIPYGTEMYIRTPDGSYIYGYAIAADTGGFTSWGNTIADLYMYSYSDCVKFGRRNIEIYIL